MTELEHRLQTRLDASLKLVHLTCALAGEQSLDRILEIVTGGVRDALESERGTLYLHDERTGELYTRTATQLEIAEIRIPEDHGVAGWVTRHRRMANIPEARADDRWSPDFDDRTGFRTRNVLATPVVSIHDDRLLGVLQVLNRRDRDYDEFDERLVEAFAAHAATALERAHLLTQAHRSEELRILLDVGHRIQSGFQPQQVPDVAGYEIASWWEPTESLGGDYYDLLELPDGRLGIVVADVSGHGFGASLIMASARAMFRVLARTFSEPEAILSLLSDSITPDLPEGRFITFCNVAVDPRDHSLTFANAGHGPVLMFRAGGHVEELASTCLPIGFVEDHVVPTGRLLHVERGDVLLMPTDGVVELRNDDGQLFGVERLKNVVREHQSRPPAELLERVREAMLAFQPSGNVEDDVTLVIVSRR